MAKKRVKKTKKTCPHCNKESDSGSRFCKHCGASLFPKSLARKHHCPSCRGMVEEFSRFCKHCGANIDTFAHLKIVRFLVYLILFLIVVLSLLIFFAPSTLNKTEVVEDAVKEFDVSQAFIRLSGSFCSWADDSFKSCTNVNWKGGEGDYVVCDFDGGEIDGEKVYSSPATCCGNAGEKEGLKLVKAYLFNKDGIRYKEDGDSVECSGKPPAEKFDFIKKSKVVERSFWFAAKQDTGHAGSSGEVLLSFPGKVQSCEYVGRYEMKQPFRDVNSFCNGASGTFRGSADFYGQRVYNDANAFWWAGSSLPTIDPSEVFYEGYGLYVLTCDPKYYSDPRYYVRGKFSGFGTKTLRFDWEYYNEFPKPQVDVFFDLVCEVFE